MPPSKTTASASKGHARWNANRFDGGEATFGLVLRNFPWLKDETSPAENQRVTASEVSGKARFGYDGGQNRSWAFLRRSGMDDGR